MLRLLTHAITPVVNTTAPQPAVLQLCDAVGVGFAEYMG